MVLGRLGDVGEAIGEAVQKLVELLSKLNV
jgi:hypothetical protein